jgi:hypothetical protein
MKFKTVLQENDKFESYKTAIKDKFKIDISKFKDQSVGGRADGKKITDFPLDEIMKGIPVEREHTSDSMKSLEIVLDHLSELKDYYTRLLKMEKEAKSETTEEE